MVAHFFHNTKTLLLRDLSCSVEIVAGEKNNSIEVEVSGDSDYEVCLLQEGTTLKVVGPDPNQAGSKIINAINMASGNSRIIGEVTSSHVIINGFNYIGHDDSDGEVNKQLRVVIKVPPSAKIDLEINNANAKSESVSFGSVTINNDRSFEVMLCIVTGLFKAYPHNDKRSELVVSLNDPAYIICTGSCLEVSSATARTSLLYNLRW